MIADYRTLLDSNVLANYGVCDLYLRLGEKPRMLIPKWSDQILEEVYRTHIKKLDWPKDLADYFQTEINKAYPDASISGYQELIPIMKYEK